MKVTQDRYGMLTYQYSIGPDMGFAFHTLHEVGAPWQMDAYKKLASLCERRGVDVERGVEIPFAPFVADFVVVRDRVRPCVVLGQTKQKLFYVGGVGTWDVICAINGRRTIVGPTYGKRVNFFDRAVQLAQQKEDEMLRYYQQKGKR